MADKTFKDIGTADVDGVRRKMVDQADGTWAEQVAVISATASGLNAQVVGNVAHDVADAGNPVKIGGKGLSSRPTAVTAGNRVNAWLGLTGSQMVGGALATSADGAGNTIEVWPEANTGAAGQWGTRSYLFNGASWDRPRTPNIFKTLSAVVVTSESTIWTPTSGKKFRLMGYCLSQGVATGAITVKDNTSGTTILIIPQHTIGVSSGLVSLGNGILSAAANNVLTFTGASTETVTGFVFGTEE